jgi:predicted permease
MTASGFRIARVAAVLGRTFLDADERPDAPPVAVIGYRLWQQRYAGRQDIIGQAIQVGEIRHSIVGVMPEDFAFPVNNRIWIPLRLSPAEFPQWHAPRIDVFGRLAPGATIEDVTRQAQLVGKRLVAVDSAEHADLLQRVIPYTRTFIDSGDAIWTYHLIQVIVTLLLVVIGTNVAVLVYARTAGRMGEIAIRTALGASRARIVGQLFAEAFALSLVAVVVGLLMAWLGMEQIDAGLQRIIGEELPYWLRIQLTPGVVIYAIVLGVIGAVIIGAIPALKITGGRVRASLAQLGGGGSALRLGKPWMAMIVAQVAIAVAVLPVAIAGITRWRHADAAQSVIAAKQILTASISYDLPIGRMDSVEAATRQVSSRTAFLDRLRANPRVLDLVIATDLLADEHDQRYEPDPANAVAAKSGEIVGSYGSVEPRYFEVLGINMLAGRNFTSADLGPSANVVMVNRTFVRKLFDGRMAVGSRIRVRRPGGASDTTRSAPWETIIGVVADFPVDSATSPRVYRPMSAAAPVPVAVAMKLSGGNALEFAPALRRAALASSASLRLENIKTLSQATSDFESATRLTIVVLELITLSTILLSAAGIYALMAFTITRRRREIGIRSALGAAPFRLLLSEMRRVLAQIAIGIAIGSVIAFAIDTSLQGGWTGRRGVAGLGLVAGLMLAIGILSALRPAIGALRIQPTEALRSE